ncbi:hypothetical protein KAU34_06705 [candidate division WOR-3 bacterium]|nr:hypothetical protein [candidate division WOR-3 bacterium]
MKTYLVLPEVFLKYFTSNDTKTLNKIEKLFKKAEDGKIKLLLPEGLFFLLVMELEKIIKKKDNLTDCLDSILNLHNLKVRNEMVLRNTIIEMRKGMNFIEAYKSVVIPILSLDGVINSKRLKE